MPTLTCALARKGLKMKLIEQGRLPAHIGFIMDGNGRWATRRKMPRSFGHKKGADALENIVDYCFEIGIKCVSVFAFSTENWKRPKQEIDYIFDLLRDFIKKRNEKGAGERESEIKQRNTRLHISGDISRLPQDLVDEIKRAQEETKDCDGHILNVALNYGGRDDIVHACNALLAQGKRNITEQDFAEALYSNGLPELDFVIRTAGDIRLSNFMLYQCAYAELYFTKTMWPDFTPKKLNKALKDFSKRNRKFGSIKN